MAVVDIKDQMLIRTHFDDAAFPIGVSDRSNPVVAIGALADEAAPDSVDEGDIGIPRMTLTRLLKTKLIGDDSGVDRNVAVNSSGQLEIEVVSSVSSHAEDSVHTSGDFGQFILAVRNDAGTALAADGDYIPLTTDANGRLRVDAEFTAAYDFAEDETHTSGDRGAFILAVRNDTITNDLTSTDLDYSPIAVSSEGHILSKLVGNNGGTPVLIAVDGSGHLQTDVLSVAGQFAEDSVHTSGDIGQFVLAVRNDAITALSSTDGDYAPIQVDEFGAVRVYDTGIADNGIVNDHQNTDGSDPADGATATVATRTPTGVDLYVKSIMVSSSAAPCRVEVNIGTNTEVVAFYSAASPFIQIQFPQPLKVADGETLDIDVTNNSGSTQTIYATINGIEVA